MKHLHSCLFIKNWAYFQQLWHVRIIITVIFFFFFFSYFYQDYRSDSQKFFNLIHDISSTSPAAVKG